MKNTEVQTSPIAMQLQHLQRHLITATGARAAILVPIAVKPLLNLLNDVIFIACLQRARIHSCKKFCHVPIITDTCKYHVPNTAAPPTESQVPPMVSFPDSPHYGYAKCGESGNETIAKLASSVCCAAWFAVVGITRCHA